jgi:hypothetical protein
MSPFLEIQEKRRFPSRGFPLSSNFRSYTPEGPFLEGSSNENVLRSESFLPMFAKFGIIIDPKDSIS